MKNRISLNETAFTNICKFGNYTYLSKGNTTDEIKFTKRDIKYLALGEIVEKKLTNNYEISLQDIGLELIREIIKRSPIYSDLYYEIELNN